MSNSKDDKSKDPIFMATELHKILCDQIQKFEVKTDTDQAMELMYQMLFFMMIEYYSNVGIFGQDALIDLMRQAETRIFGGTNLIDPIDHDSDFFDKSIQAQMDDMHFWQQSNKRS